MERFGAPWERSLRISTWLFAGVLLLVAALFAGLHGWDGIRAAPRWATWTVPVVLGVAALLAWALSPRAFTIGGGELTVVRALFPVRIPLASVRAVALVGRQQAGWLVRVAGSGGAFGYFGRFWSRGLGAIRLYATRRDQLVVVDTDGARFVLTPATPERFVEALQAAAPMAARGIGVLAPGLRPALPWKLLVGIASAVVLFAAALLIPSAASAPVAVTVEADAIRIERRWAEPVRLPLSEVREVAVLPPAQAGGWWRVHGVGGLGQTAYGDYASTALGQFTLYAWRRGDPYVLLETAGGRVVLSPDDPAAFVEAVRAELERRRP